MVEFKTISYEVVTVGEEFMSEDFVIKPEDVETYAYAVGDHNSWFFEDSPFGGPIAHPTLLGNQALLMRHSKYIVPAGLHAKMQFEFIEPLRVGMRVRTHGKVIDKYEKRGRHYMVTQFETREEGSGQPLVRGQFTQMIFPESGVHRETTNR
ncbi:MAG TPA: MaoC family dehydratase [Burkholderiales bacterium]|jgi:acyl dehydratase|nr:MaoC family dehydratase [Burkholderiales bacterium]